MGKPTFDNGILNFVSGNEMRSLDFRYQMKE